MGMYDWVAVFISSYIIGLTIGGEITDIFLCEKLEERSGLSARWKAAFAFINRTRAHVFLSLVLMTVPAVILTRGGSALDVCFNTVAILFLFEVVSAIFHACRARVNG